jgi:hypothetical protein
MDCPTQLRIILRPIILRPSAEAFFKTAPVGAYATRAAAGRLAAWGSDQPQRCLITAPALTAAAFSHLCWGIFGLSLVTHHLAFTASLKDAIFAL